MNLKSLAYRTDLLFWRFNGKITDRREYLVIEAPDNPGYFWGNLLLFSKPPTQQDYPRWKDLFRKEFAHQPKVTHFTFGWDGIDGNDGCTKAFVDEGFEVQRSVVLTANSTYASSKENLDLIVRPLQKDSEWEEALENQVLCRQGNFKEDRYREFKRTQMKHYRAMTESGLGCWFGGFLHGKLVADLGIYMEASVGRFQSVGTHPLYRRKGICGTLVNQASQVAFKKMGAQKLVMVADEFYHAAKVYESVGFRPAERQGGMYWWDRKS